MTETDLWKLMEASDVPYAMSGEPRRAGRASRVMRIRSVPGDVG